MQIRRHLSNLFALLLPLTDVAQAADGYFLIGYGPRQKALAGAGAADQRDAMALSVNPAGIVGVKRQFAVGLTAINADRGYDTSGPTRVIAPGPVQSGRPWFPVPNGGYIQPIDDDSAWSVATYANGGVNTSYGWGYWHPPRGGLFGGGFTGVDLQQAFMYRSMGTGSGPVFDWRDTDSGAVGVEWRYSPVLTLRTGYHYSTNPLRGLSVTVNVLSPVINRHHASLGVNYAFTERSSLDFAFVYAFRNAFTGVEWLPQQPRLPNGGANPLATITPWAQGWELTLGYNYKWADRDESLLPRKL